MRNGAAANRASQIPDFTRFDTLAPQHCGDNLAAMRGPAASVMPMGAVEFAVFVY